MLTPATPLCIEQLHQPEDLKRWLPALMGLIEPWLPVLQDDGTQALRDLQVLQQNLLSQLPYLWIAYNQCGEVAASGCITQIIPGRYGYIHGIRALAYRKHPALRWLTALIFEEAFTALGLCKLKAQFESDNPGALGFCRLNGFTKEAHFREENSINGQLKDVVVYSLFRSRYEAQKEALNDYAIR